jgi:NADPH-dependent F420 reductase
MRIAIVGGTGREGQGLAGRWARAGHSIRLGSREASRAEARALAIAAAAGGAVTGGSNDWATLGAEVVVLSVPYRAHAETIRALAPLLPGRLLLDVTVPLRPPHIARVTLPEGKAAALEARALVGHDTPVVAALHHVSSTHLADLSHPIESDVLVCGDDSAAVAIVLALVEDLGARAFDAGPLDNAVALETLTPVLLHLARRYGSQGPGIRIMGLDPRSR